MSFARHLRKIRWFPGICTTLRQSDQKAWHLVRSAVGTMTDNSDNFIGSTPR